MTTAFDFFGAIAGLGVRIVSMYITNERTEKPGQFGICHFIPESFDDFDMTAIVADEAGRIGTIESICDSPYCGDDETVIHVIGDSFSDYWKLGEFAVLDWAWGE